MHLSARTLQQSPSPCISQNLATESLSRASLRPCNRLPLRSSLRTLQQSPSPCISQNLVPLPCISQTLQQSPSPVHLSDLATESLSVHLSEPCNRVPLRASLRTLSLSRASLRTLQQSPSPVHLSDLATESLSVHLSEPCNRVPLRASLRTLQQSPGLGLARSGTA